MTIINYYIILVNNNYKMRFTDLLSSDEFQKSKRSNKLLFKKKSKVKRSNDLICKKVK